MSRVLVVGAGSIGLRHASVLEEMGHEVALVTQRDDTGLIAFRSPREAVDSLHPDYVVVAVETALHSASVAALAAAGFEGQLLVEKPLAVESSQLEAFTAVGVGYNLRFHPVIERLVELFDGVTIHAVEVYVGQHLSTWRPSRGIDHQYSSYRSRGGGVLRDLSHEFDYLGLLLGECRGVFALGGRVAEVTVDSDDAWGIVAEYDRASVVTIQLNYLDTVARRRILANTSAGTIEADLVAGTVTVDGQTEIFVAERDDTYRAMHASMLDGRDRVTTVDEALSTEQVIGMIETSAETRAWVVA